MPSCNCCWVEKMSRREEKRLCHCRLACSAASKNTERPTEPTNVRFQDISIGKTVWECTNEFPTDTDERINYSHIVGCSRSQPETSIERIVPKSCPPPPPSQAAASITELAATSMFGPSSISAPDFPPRKKTKREGGKGKRRTDQPTETDGRGQDADWTVAVGCNNECSSDVDAGFPKSVPWDV